jgi:HlyD family secretion protein
VFVNTNDIDDVNIGDRVELILRRRDTDRTQSGTITAIDSTAVIRASSRGSEERLVKITVLPDLQDEFKIGYDVDVKFHFYREENVLVVPRSALFTENGKNMVWLVNGGTLSKTEVNTGRILRQEITIAGGLSEGDVIALDAESGGLRNGMRVR